MSLSSRFADLAATPRMPALFVGHGSPMNAIEDNEISRGWRAVGDSLPVPKAILVVSAHWMSRGTSLVHIAARPRTIHDFGGFPDELYAQTYPAPGSPEFAAATLDLLQHAHTRPDERWGLDHGAWSVLIKMFPKADIPVYQLSLDLDRSFDQHLALARDLKALRERGVMIIASGNVVHNLGAMQWDAAAPYDWAVEFDAYVTAAMLDGDPRALTDLRAIAPAARSAHPSVDHYLPLLYTLGVRDDRDTASEFNGVYQLASIAMRCFLYQ